MLNKEKNKKTKKKSGDTKVSKFKEKLDMYDMIIANILAGNSVVEPSETLRNSDIAIGFSNISSETQISKYFLIRKLPDWLSPQLYDRIRSACVLEGVKINFYVYGDPHVINWDSPEMINKMSIWKQYSSNVNDNVNVFEYRSKRDSVLSKERIIVSTKYLNESELDNRRSIVRVSFLIEVSAARNDKAIMNMMNSIKNLKNTCGQMDVRIRELKINMIDWLQALGAFSLRGKKEVESKISKRVVTDDILANFNGYKQGRVGFKGVPLGIDVLSLLPVIKKFKEDPDASENWLITAATGEGKSFFLKVLLTYLLADGFVVTVMDYEGDEYDPLASYIAAGNPEDVKVVSLGKGSSVYFDPVEIAELTGDMDVDLDLKKEAGEYILSTFRLITCGVSDNLTQPEEKVISMAISRVYDSNGVTNDMQTWHRSKGLRLKDIYDEIKIMVETKELADEASDNIKHKAAMKIVDAASVYFEEGEIKANTFKNPMSANELYKAKFIVFSFGMRGAGNSQTDPVTLALKQLCVANISIQISNYCKYVRKCFNVKVWEEFQRWGEATGSSEIISNAVTGGRKRGDCNFIVTNDLAAILDENNALNRKLVSNIQNFAVGKILDNNVREKFCKIFGFMECKYSLDLISKARKRSSTSKDKSSRSQGSRYQFSFCVILDNGKRAIVKPAIPKVITESNLFKTGVHTKEKGD